MSDTSWKMWVGLFLYGFIIAGVMMGRVTLEVTMKNLPF